VSDYNLSTKRVEQFECDDRYEAEKLAGFLAIQKDDFTYLRGVANVIENELVIILKDSSSHSVLLKDKSTAIRLRSLIEDIVKGIITIYGSSFENQRAEIITIVLD
jgi:hypothetical protein